MKFKNEVVVTKNRENIYTLSLGGIDCIVNTKDGYIVDAIEQGLNNEDDLKALIVEKEKSNEILAGFTLAQFILNYQQYVEEDRSHYTITD